MNKKLISAAVMLGVSGAATAVNVNPDGLGQVLLYPYYTGNDGKTTSVHVVNTTGESKAVKVRFSEAGNTWEILDFNLYLSPYDVWTAAFSLDDDGNPLIQTRDTSCTVPAFTVTDSATNLARVPASHNFAGNIDAYGSVTEADEAAFDDLTSAQRVAEGHIEMIEMGTVSGTLSTALTHNNGVPNDCGALTTSWVSGAWASDRDAGIGLPSGGLFGIANIIDIPNGIDRGYDAVAIDNFWDPALMTANANTAHVRPGSSYPNLNGTVLTNNNAVRNLGSTESNLIVPGTAVTPTLVTDTWTSTVDALSAVLTVSSIYNEFYTYSGTASGTDWVISFPTKHFYVNPTTGSGDKGQEGGFDTFFGGEGEFCQTVNITLFDQEETTAGGNVNFSPYEPATDGLCYETNVVEFSADNSVLASNMAKTVANNYTAGWANIKFANSMAVGPNTGLYYHGLPAIGFAAQDAKNGTLNGGSTLANYASAFVHKYNRQVVTTSSL